MSANILIQASMGNVFAREPFLKWIDREGNYAIFDYSAGDENYQSYKDILRIIFPKVIAGHSIESRQRLGNKLLENLHHFIER